MHGEITSQVWTASFIKHPLSSLKKIFRAQSLSNMVLRIFLLFSPPPNWSPVLPHKNLWKSTVINEKKNPIIYYSKLNTQLYNVTGHRKRMSFHILVKAAVIFIDLYSSFSLI